MREPIRTLSSTVQEFCSPSKSVIRQQRILSQITREKKLSRKSFNSSRAGDDYFRSGLKLSRSGCAGSRHTVALPLVAEALRKGKMSEKRGLFVRSRLVSKTRTCRSQSFTVRLAVICSIRVSQKVLNECARAEKSRGPLQAPYAASSFHDRSFYED